MKETAGAPGRRGDSFPRGKWPTEGASVEVLTPDDQGMLATVTQARREQVTAALAGREPSLRGHAKRGAYERQRLLGRVFDKFLEGFLTQVGKLRDFAGALRPVNDSRYGFEAGVFWGDARLLFEAVRELKVGTVIAGDVPSLCIDHMPQGRVRDSGLGGEGLRQAIEEMTERKTLVIGD